MQVKENLILTIMGPTGVGKTDLVIDLFAKLPIKIVSVDSVQVYKLLNIGSGKPSKEVLKDFPHDLIDLIEPTENYSTARFQKDVIQSIEDSFNSNLTPVLVGGTMMYFHHLINGISNLPIVPVEIREAVEQEFSKKGPNVMHDYLKDVDRKSSLKIHPNDSQRIKRAIEIYRTTGKQFSKWLEDQKAEVSSVINSSNLIQIAIKPEDKKLHKESVAKRFKKMIDDGLVHEVENILNIEGMSSNSQSMKSVGYKQVCQFLENDCNFDDMIEKAINSTRQLAKRQMTWINGWSDLILLEKNNTLPKSVEDLILRNS